MAVDAMRRRIYDPFGKLDRQRYPDSPVAPSADSSDTQTSSGTSTRTLKVEQLEPSPDNPNEKAILRLKGKWLAAIFAPETRVSVKVEPGRIVIEPVEQ
jgi:hypothetical protein